MRCTLWLNGGGAGCFNWSGQGLGRNFGVLNIKGSDVRGALEERKGEGGHNKQEDEWIGQAGRWQGNLRFE